MDALMEAMLRLKRQGISLNKPAGLPPRIAQEYLFQPQSRYESGEPVSRASDDSVNWSDMMPGKKTGSTLGMMSQELYDRVFGDFLAKRYRAGDQVAEEQRRPRR